MSSYTFFFPCMGFSVTKTSAAREIVGTVFFSTHEQTYLISQTYETFFLLLGCSVTKTSAARAAFPTECMGTLFLSHTQTIPFEISHKIIFFGCPVTKTSTARAAFSTEGMGTVFHVSLASVAQVCLCVYTYGVAMISRLLKIIGLFCRISSLL